MSSRKPTKAELEYYANAKPHVREEPGYFDDGDFVYGPFFRARLGTKGVGYSHGSYIEAHGCYRTRQDALQGAKLFQQKARELLEAGEYV